MTFECFKELEQEKPVDEDGNGDEEVEAVKAKPVEQTENLPRSVFVKEVVREPRMHFFKVPRLGSYLAVRLEYKSCLFEESLDSAVHDYLEVRHKLKE